ncbi:DNA primase family protein [Gordonia neofelifaecis]|uniref:p4 family phage/plasmid primase n=1 Tax=Gordonia neofelifaecis NRRL B-59395 TaxID=644548 RepID=F1YE78_9ACTN|nr:phage/plasmid primase, P4 family [Gordonia neofelifaecis]EGD57168.1 P4 family phage/plasmid primase [Gordonia neofelifaecis NRRL B-59395]
MSNEPTSYTATDDFDDALLVDDLSGVTVAADKDAPVDYTSAARREQDELVASMSDLVDPDDPSKDASGVPFATSVEDLATAATDVHLRPGNIDGLKKLPPAVVRKNLLNLINAGIRQENERVKRGLRAGTKRAEIGRLGHYELARLVSALHSIILIAPSTQKVDRGDMLLAVYDDDPESMSFGLYLADPGHLEAVVRRYQPGLDTKSFVEVVAALRSMVPVRERGTDPDLIATRNGIVDFRTKTSVPFSPEYVFLAKLGVDWNPDAVSPVIPNPKHCLHDDRISCTSLCTCSGDHDDPADCTSSCQTWDVESWMADLIDDPEVTTLLWEIVSAVIRPYISWNKAVFFYSQQGNNGKGTLLAMIRNLLGRGNYASLPLADFGHEFKLEDLVGTSAILTDENDVGTYIDKAANFKAIVTNDVIMINRKNRRAIKHQHYGLMIQCFNDKPTVKDKSESLLRRLMFIHFDKSFTGRERKYIKDDYLHRRDVLEYVLLRALSMGHYELSEPAAVKAALDEFKEYNDPVLAFWREIRTQITWRLAPAQFLFDMYKSWMVRNMPNSKALGRYKFYDQLYDLVRDGKDSIWVWDREAQPYAHGRLSGIEPLIAEFDLDDWADVSKRGTRDFARLPASKLKDRYRGLLRHEDIELDAARAAISSILDTPPTQAEIDAANAHTEPELSQQSASPQHGLTADQLDELGMTPTTEGAA